MSEIFKTLFLHINKTRIYIVFIALLIILVVFYFWKITRTQPEIEINNKPANADTNLTNTDALSSQNIPTITPYRKVLLVIYRSQIISILNTLNYELMPDTTSGKMNVSFEVKRIQNEDRLLEMYEKILNSPQKLNDEELKKLNTINVKLINCINNIKLAYKELDKYYNNGESFYLLKAKESFAGEKANLEEIKNEAWDLIVQAYKADIANNESQEINNAFLEYIKTYENPYVLALKKSITSYSINYETESVPENPVISKSYAKYLDSYFVVFNINDFMAGGKLIEIIFQNNPDKIFVAWVYKLADGSYELRRFEPNSDYSKEQIDQINVKYAKLINYSILAL